MSYDGLNEPPITYARIRRSAAHVDPEWVSRVVGVVQVLASVAAITDVEIMQRALSRFAQDCPVPRSAAERLILQGLLLDTFLRLETVLQDDLTPAQKSAARSKLHQGQATSIAAFSGAASYLIGSAARMRAKPLHDRACCWLEAHLSERHTVREIASQLGTNSRTLMRHFTRHVGVTIQQYQWRLRASRAIRLLAETDLTVREVAGAVGVRSKSTLYRILRQSLKAPGPAAPQSDRK